MATQGSTTVNFGSGALDAQVAVTGQAGITTGNLVEAWTSWNGTDDSPWVEQMQCTAGNIVAGTGFTIVVKPAMGRAYGSYTINWVWN
jgi:hypothetical protein